MALLTTKRKRADVENNSPDHSEDEAVVRARFQRAFEAKFKPLPVQRCSPQAEVAAHLSEDGHESDDSEWGGISGDERSVEIVDHGENHAFDMQDIAAEKKAFMSSKPPSSNDRAAKVLKVTKDVSAEEPQEAANLKHDLALQRLLKESHLLDPTSFAERSSGLEGKGRHKALDLRLKDLGAKESISTQEKMPLSHRRGIATKATSRDKKRRSEAVENGVVLEKARLAVKASKPRERSVVGATVGKFRGGTLKLNSKDVKSVQGSMRSGFGGRDGRRK